MSDTCRLASVLASLDDVRYAAFATALGFGFGQAHTTMAEAGRVARRLDINVVEASQVLADTFTTLRADPGLRAASPGEIVDAWYALLRGDASLLARHRRLTGGRQ